MISSNVRSRQPHREVWTRERLIHERAIALGQAVDNSTWKNYGSALNSYLNFVKMHDYPLDPTPDTLSLFTVYMCHHIKPDSVGTYLSGICHQLEPYFPDVRSSRNSALVHRTLQGCKRIRAVPTSRKRALTIGDLETVVDALSSSTDYDDNLFLAQLLTGFFALFRLGEMTYPDDPELRDPRKVTKRNSVQTNDVSYKFFLPGHKADRFFEGNTIILATPSSHLAHRYGSPARVLYQLVLSSYGDCVDFLTQIPLANHSGLEEPPPSQKTAYLHQ